MTLATETGTSDALAQREEEMIFRAAAFIVSAHGDDAVAYARRLESASAVPEIAKRVRMQVELMVV